MTYYQVLYQWRGDWYATEVTSKSQAKTWKRAFDSLHWSSVVSPCEPGEELPVQGKIPDTLP